METFKLKVLASDKIFYDDDAIMVKFMTVDGSYGVLAHHSNTIMAVVPCTMKIVDKEENNYFAVVSGGLVKIENNTVLALVENAERPENIDLVVAEKEKALAEEEILQKRSNKEYASAEARLARAMSKISAKNNMDENGQN